MAVRPSPGLLSCWWDTASGGQLSTPDVRRETDTRGRTCGRCLLHTLDVPGSVRATKVTANHTALGERIAFEVKA